jgi:hypothetical protein
MAFSPAINAGGFAGWLAFERTSDRQFAGYEKSPTLQRELSYFRDNIDKVTTASALVSDRRLIALALGAFGLESEASKKAIIRRVLEESPDDPASIANRLNDPRWRQFARTFGFASGAPNFSSAAFQSEIADRYARRSFEIAVGEADADFRLALNFRREIRAIAQGANVDQAGWFQVLAQQPVRRVIETAFGLPEAFASLDIDRQRAILEQKAERAFGQRSASAFADQATVDLTLRRFFLSRTATPLPSTSAGVAALTLLSGAGGVPSGALFIARAVGG